METTNTLSQDSYNAIAVPFTPNKVKISYTVYIGWQCESDDMQQIECERNGQEYKRSKRETKI